MKRIIFTAAVILWMLVIFVFSAQPAAPFSRNQSIMPVEAKVYKPGFLSGEQYIRL